MAFKKATKREAILRLALVGPANSGKTRTALEVASRLGKRIAVIDSEGGRSKAYSDMFEFDVDDELPDYSPETYIKAIRSAQEQDYDVIIVDSASHEWAGKGGVLGKVDQVAARSNNKFTAWAVGTPAHQAFVDAVIQCRCHIILTMRAKTEWVLELDERGKQKPRAVGVGAVQRDGTEYEVDFVGQLDDQHRLLITKETNYPELANASFDKPGEDLANAFKKWLADKPAPTKLAPRPVAHAAPVQPAAPAKEEAPAATLIATVAPATAATDTRPSAAGPSATEPKAHDPLASLTAQIESATTEEGLTAAAKVIGEAHKAGKITDADRSELVKVYLAKQAAIRGQRAA